MYDDYQSMLKEFERSLTVEELSKYRLSLAISIEIIRARNKAGLIPLELSIKAGLPKNTVARIENGSLFPSIKTLMKIARALDKRLEIKLVDITLEEDEK